MSSYKTIQGIAEAEIVEKKSRFISHLCHVNNEEEALEYLDKIRSEHSQARHNVYAYILKDGRARYSDDGEPAQTSGIVTYEVLNHAGLSDVICVTTRYFGGVLLGTGGLARAYTAACKAAINIAVVETIITCVDTEVIVPYSYYHNVASLADSKTKIVFSNFTDVVSITLRCAEEDSANLVAKITNETNGQAQIKVSKPFEGTL